MRLNDNIDITGWVARQIQAVLACWKSFRKQRASELVPQIPAQSASFPPCNHFPTTGAPNWSVSGSLPFITGGYVSGEYVSQVAISGEWPGTAYNTGQSHPPRRWTLRQTPPSNITSIQF